MSGVDTTGVISRSGTRTYGETPFRPFHPKAANAKAVTIAWGRDSFEAHFNLGIARCRTSQFSEGAQAFEGAVALRPNSAEAHCFLGVALANLGRRDEAIAHLAAALRLRPDYPEATQ